MHPEHQEKGTDQCHQGNEQVLGAVMGNLADFFQILGQPRHQMAGLLVVEEPEGQLLQMIEGLPPHLRLDLDAQHMPPIGDNDLESGIEHIDEKQAQSRERNQPELVGRQQPVDENRHRDRKSQLQHTGDDGA